MLISYKSNSGILALLALGLMLCVYTVTNKIIVGLSGSLLVGLMLWSFFEVRRSKNIDSKTKRGIWFVLLVVASVIAVMIMKLIGQQKIFQQLITQLSVVFSFNFSK
jgi:hypothetical protein